MARLGIACDLCELNRDLAWIIRTDEFTVGAGIEGQEVTEMDVLSTFSQDEEWALCNACKRDVLNDEQAPILARRRQALIMDTPASEWDSYNDEQRSAVLQMLDITVMAVLSCRQKRWGRLWTARDAAQAAAAIEHDGQRGLRHDGRE